MSFKYLQKQPIERLWWVPLVSTYLKKVSNTRGFLVGVRDWSVDNLIPGDLEDFLFPLLFAWDIVAVVDGVLFWMDKL